MKESGRKASGKKGTGGFGGGEGGGPERRGLVVGSNRHVVGRARGGWLADWPWTGAWLDGQVEMVEGGGRMTCTPPRQRERWDASAMQAR